jgi:dipeptidyl aminopeptidase/acylaminoacyl peptidase
MRRIVRLAIAVVVGVVLGSVFAAHNALVIWSRPAPDPGLADELARAAAASWETARVTAADGAVLEAWLFTPRTANGAGVVVLHGVGDSRRGMLTHAQFLLRSGYTVLTPDARGHGSSGGKHVTFGVRESHDVRLWVDWLVSRGPVERLYGLGFSMGAAVLLQSLAVAPRFRAVVAESPFVTFEEIAYDRFEQATGAPRPALWPIVNIGFAYAWVRYGVNLRRASPLDAVRATSVPVLLIHGDRDRNIEIRHSRVLHAANPAALRLWEVAGADHVNALGAAGPAYIRAVDRWYRSH